MIGDKVVSIASRMVDRGAKEYAMFFKLIGVDVQFKIVGGDLSDLDKADIAEACEAVAKALRKPKY